MTDRGRHSPSRAASTQAPKAPQISVIGTREEIAAMRADVERTWTVVRSSRLIQRRDEQGRYTLYLTVQL